MKGGVLANLGSSSKRKKTTKVGTFLLNDANDRTTDIETIASISKNVDVITKRHDNNLSSIG